MPSASDGEIIRELIVGQEERFRIGAVRSDGCQSADRYLAQIFACYERERARCFRHDLLRRAAVKSEARLVQDLWRNDRALFNRQDLFLVQRKIRKFGKVARQHLIRVVVKVAHKHRVGVRECVIHFDGKEIVVRYSVCSTTEERSARLISTGVQSKPAISSRKEINNRQGAGIYGERSDARQSAQSRVIVGHYGRCCDGLSLAQAFVASEEECLILNYGAARSEAKLISPEWTFAKTARVIEEVCGIQRVVA